MSQSMSEDIFWSVTCAYTCVLLMFVCPIILAMLSIGIPEVIIRVPNECLAIWKVIGYARKSRQVKIKRKSFEMSMVSVFCQVEKKQVTAEYWGCSVTKPLAGQLPEREQVTESNEKKSSPFCLHSYTVFCTSRNAYMASNFALKNISVWK